MSELPRISKTRSAALLLLLVLVPGGAFLELSLGSRFILFFGAQYQAVAWWAFVLLLPIVGVTLFNERMRSHLRLRYPTWWVRWLVMFPLIASLASGTIVVAPLGWMAAFTWAAGEEKAPIEGRLLSVDEYRSTAKGCDQRGTLTVLTLVASICLENIATLPMRGNQPVAIGVQESQVGILIRSVANR